ncbi:MAG: hypothetical protein EDR02_01930 [Actinobacteria bacterium]|nr:MAG: hypothetical protein EDR02_01930 [Actinomycetota bacterium]
MAAKTRFKDIAGRLTGISCPIFGVSWEPPTLDADVARRVIVFLEDRRVLCDPTEVEVEEHCIESVMRIREFLTDQLAEGRIADELVGHLRAMRAACRLFLTKVHATDEREDGPDLWIPPVCGQRHRSGLDDWHFNQTLGQLRGTFGIQIAQLAVKYGIDLEDQLASILPAADET